VTGLQLAAPKRRRLQIPAALPEADPVGPGNWRAFRAKPVTADPDAIDWRGGASTTILVLAVALGRLGGPGKLPRGRLASSRS